MALFGLFGKSSVSANTNDMSFWGHFDALRKHITRSVIAVLIIAIALFCFPEFLFDTIIFAPLSNSFITYRAFCKLSHLLNVGDQLCFGSYSFKLQSLGLSDQFTSQMWIAFIGGIIIGSPYVLWQLWQFIKLVLDLRSFSFSAGFMNCHNCHNT